MKGLDKIIGRIRADAQAEIDAIRAEGDAKAAAIAADYQAQADALAAAICHGHSAGNDRLKQLLGK